MSIIKINSKFKFNKLQTIKTLIVLFSIIIIMLACSFYKNKSVIAEDSIYSAKNLLIGFNRVESVKENVSFPSYAIDPTTKGISVKGAAGASFLYAKTIDVSRLTKNDEIISFQVDSEVSIFKNITVRLIDAHDISNSIAVRFKDGENPNSAVVYAMGEFGNYSLGMNYTDHYPEAGWIINMPRSNYGTVLGGLSLNGHIYIGGETPQKNLNFRYDASEVALYVNTNYHIGGYSGNKMILPLQDATKLTKTWQGFKGTKAYLQVEFTEGAGTVIIDKIMGENLSSVETDEFQNRDMLIFKNESEFNSVIENGVATSILHDGAVNYNYPLPVNVPQNIVLGNITVEKKLIDPTGKDITSQIINNSFNPTQTGKYQLSFSTIDQFKFEVVHKFSFDVKAQPSVFEFPAEIPNTTVKVRDNFFIPNLSVNGGSGLVKFNNYIIYNDKEEQVSAGDIIKIDRTGDLLLKIVALDSIGYTDEKEYPITIDDNVQYFKGGGIPRSLPANTEIIFPELEAFDYLGEPKDSEGKPMTTILYVDGESLGLDRKFETPSSGSVILKYIAGEGTVSEFQSTYSITILSTTSTKSFKDNFIHIGPTVSRTVFSHGIEFSAIGGNQSIGIPYPVAAEETFITFNVLKGIHNSFSSVVVRLTDYYDPNNIVEVSIGNIFSQTPTFYVNGVLTKDMIAFNDNVYPNNNSTTTAYRGLATRSFTLSFNSQYNQFFGTGEQPLSKVTKRFDGLEFKGFARAVLIDIKTENSSTSGTNSIIIEKICNTNFNLDVDQDYRGPTISFAKIMKNESVRLNTLHTLPQAFSYDVLQYFSKEVKVFVYNPSGQVLVNDLVVPTGGHDILLDTYGTYIVIYQAKDEIGNTTRKTYTITVKDFDAPVIVCEAPESTVVVGSMLKIPTYKVTDNKDIEPIVYIMIRRPDGAQLEVQQGKDFSMHIEGLYILSVYVRDASGNSSFIFYSINVVTAYP